MSRRPQSEISIQIKLDNQRTNFPSTLTETLLMNSEQFQNLLQSIENSDLLSAIPYNIDLIGFGEINVNHICGEVYSVFSSEDPTVLIIIAYLLGSDLRMIVTCRFNTTAELKKTIFTLQTSAYFDLDDINYSVIFELPQ